MRLSGRCWRWYRLRQRRLYGLLFRRLVACHAALAHASPPPAWGGGSPQPLSSPLACGQVVHALAVVADAKACAIRAGICKFNVNTEVRAAAVRGVASASAAGGDVLDLMRAGADAMVPVVEAKLRAFRPGS